MFSRAAGGVRGLRGRFPATGHGRPRCGRQLRFESLEGRTLLTLTIDVGDQVLLSDTADQWVELRVTSDDPVQDPLVTGLNLRAQIGDGDGSATEPVLQAVDFAGGIWDAFPNTVIGGPVIDSYVFASVAFNHKGQQVSANGRLARIKVSTAGLSSGEYPLLLQDIPRIDDDTHFILTGPVRHDPAIVNGWVIVGPATLFVTRFTPTPSGFQARFSRELNLGGLNLYDGAGGSLGAADVILTDGVGQTVRGSMVVAADRRALEFVQTGGVLPPGTYSVRFKSGVNAFRDLSDGLLDGNKDGTTGDDFTTSFTVAASAGRVVSLPDLARGAGQAVNIPNTAHGLPIRVDNAAGVTSLAVDIMYRPDLLQTAAATVGSGLPADWTVVDPPDTGTPGVAKVRASGTTPLSGSNVAAGADTAGWAVSANLVAPGQLRVGMVSPNGRPLAVGLPEIARLQFHVAASVPDAVPLAERAVSGDAVPVSERLGCAAALDIEPVDPRAGGYTWTAVDGSVALTANTPPRRPQAADGKRRAAAADEPPLHAVRDTLLGDLAADLHLLEPVLTDLAGDVAPAWR